MHYHARMFLCAGIVGLLFARGIALGQGQGQGQGQNQPANQQNETPQEKKAREDFEKSMRELNKGMKEWSQNAPKDAGKAVAACGVSCILGLLFAGLSLAVHIFVIVWTFKDATARGDQNAIVWPILGFFFPLLGLIVYLVVRPKGNLTPCASCHKGRLETLTKCPHCGADTAASKSQPA
jgi:hypothetical protein